MPAPAAEPETKPVAGGKPLPVAEDGNAAPRADGPAIGPGSPADTAAPKTVSRAHIAEQRVDADPLPPSNDAGATDARTKDKTKDGKQAATKLPNTTKTAPEKRSSDPAPVAKAQPAMAPVEKAQTTKAQTGGAKPGKPTPEKAKVQSTKQTEDTEEGKPNVPGARLSAYAEEAAELLAGLSSNRRRRKPGTDEPTADPAPGDEKTAG
jgi:hypothetical protein